MKDKITWVTTPSSIIIVRGSITIWIRLIASTVTGRRSSALELQEGGEIVNLLEKTLGELMRKKTLLNLLHLHLDHFLGVIEIDFEISNSSYSFAWESGISTSNNYGLADDFLCLGPVKGSDFLCLGQVKQSVLLFAMDDLPAPVAHHHRPYLRH